MRIFYASGHTPNGAMAGSQVWRINLNMSLVDLGHDVVEFDYDLEPLIAASDFTDPKKRGFVERHRPEAEAQLLRQIHNAHREKPIDLFFSYFYSSCARPDVIREIRGMGIVTMNWYCNASYQFHLVQEIAPAYDYCLVPERFRLDAYRHVGANPIYCQEAANPQFYKPFDLPREFDVVFMGARYAERPLYIRRLLDAGIQVRVWGPGWQRPPVHTLDVTTQKRRLCQLATVSGWRKAGRKVWRSVSPSKVALPASEVQLPPGVCGPPLSDEDMIKMYSRCKISLGFSTVGSTHLAAERIVQIRLRDFEAPMSGAFYLVEYVPGLEEFFEIGREIVCYTGPDDLVEKCRYFLAHEHERERIRHAGHKRALADHTWQKRLTDVFREVGLPS